MKFQMIVDNDSTRLVVTPETKAERMFLATLCDGDDSQSHRNALVAQSNWISEAGIYGRSEIQSVEIVKQPLQSVSEKENNRA